MQSSAETSSASAFFEQFRRQIQIQSGLRLPLALLIATGLSVLWYGLLQVFQGSYVHALFYDRGWIPFLCTWLFFLCISQLGLKMLRIRKEMQAAGSLGEASQLPDAGKGDAGQVSGSEDLILINRLRKGLQQVGKGASSSEVSSLLYDESEADYHIAESSYFLAKFLVWVVPILGFLGTVIGIATAMGDFDRVVSGANSLQSIKSQIGGITDNLGLAFETTLIALVMAALMMLVLALVQKREEDMLATVDRYAVENLLTAVAASKETDRDGTTDVTPRTGDFGEFASKLQDAVESHNRELGVLSSTIKENAAALSSANAISNVLNRNEDLQERLEQTLKAFNEVTEQYTRTLRGIYNLGSVNPGREGE